MDERTFLDRDGKLVRVTEVSGIGIGTRAGPADPRPEPNQTALMFHGEGEPPTSRAALAGDLSRPF